MPDVNQAQAAQRAKQEAREKQRQMWLERVGKELQLAEEWDANKRPDALAKRLDQMVELSNKAEMLTSADKTDIRERARTLKLRTHEKYLDSLLERTMAATRDRSRDKEKVELLKEVNEIFSTAVRLGTSQAVKDSVKERLGIIRETSATGDSRKAKEDAEREAQKKEAARQNEHRTFTRWRDPPLTVMIEGKAYTTLDWSLGGILLGDMPERNWQLGQVLDIKVGLDAAKTYPEKVEVVRYMADEKRLAVKVRRFASVLMQVKRDCDAAGLEPSE
ncbi:MAG TPA: hypothetical protein VMB81_01365 [Candidatus Sulfotelmatobacter sp.]|nr:hypothetical protein [Candidatus Sulfotelmatobacter sp.]